MKRIFLFLMTNFAILLVLSVTMAVLAADASEVQIAARDAVTLALARAGLTEQAALRPNPEFTYARQMARLEQRAADWVVDRPERRAAALRS